MRVKRKTFEQWAQDFENPTTNMYNEYCRIVDYINNENPTTEEARRETIAAKLHSVVTDADTFEKALKQHLKFDKIAKQNSKAAEALVLEELIEKFVNQVRPKQYNPELIARLEKTMRFENANYDLLESKLADGGKWNVNFKETCLSIDQRTQYIPMICYDQSKSPERPISIYPIAKTNYFDALDSLYKRICSDVVKPKTILRAAIIPLDVE